MNYRRFTVYHQLTSCCLLPYVLCGTWKRLSCLRRYMYFRVSYLLLALFFMVYLKLVLMYRCIFHFMLLSIWYQNKVLVSYNVVFLSAGRRKKGKKGGGGELTVDASHLCFNYSKVVVSGLSLLEDRLGKWKGKCERDSTRKGKCWGENYTLMAVVIDIPFRIFLFYPIDWLLPPLVYCPSEIDMTWHFKYIHMTFILFFAQSSAP